MLSFNELLIGRQLMCDVDAGYNAVTQVLI